MFATFLTEAIVSKNISYAIILRLIYFTVKNRILYSKSYVSLWLLTYLFFNLKLNTYGILIS